MTKNLPNLRLCQRPKFISTPPESYFTLGRDLFRFCPMGYSNSLILRALGGSAILESLGLLMRGVCRLYIY